MGPSLFADMREFEAPHWAACHGRKSEPLHNHNNNTPNVCTHLTSRDASTIDNHKLYSVEDEKLGYVDNIQAVTQ